MSWLQESRKSLSPNNCQRQKQECETEWLGGRVSGLMRDQRVYWCLSLRLKGEFIQVVGERRVEWHCL